MQRRAIQLTVAGLLAFVTIAAIILATRLSSSTKIGTYAAGTGAAPDITGYGAFSVFDDLLNTSLVDTSQSTADINTGKGVATTYQPTGGAWAQMNGTTSPSYASACAPNLDSDSITSFDVALTSAGIPDVVCAVSMAGGATEIRAAFYNADSKLWRGRGTANPYTVLQHVEAAAGSVDMPLIDTNGAGTGNIDVIFRRTVTDPGIFYRIEAMHFNSAAGVWTGYTGATDAVSTISGGAQPYDLVVDQLGRPHAFFGTGGTKDPAYSTFNGIAWSGLNQGDGIPTYDVVFNGTGDTTSGDLALALQGDSYLPRFAYIQDTDAQYAEFSATAGTYTGRTPTDGVDGRDELSTLFFGGAPVSVVRLQMRSNEAYVAMVQEDADLNPAINDFVRYAHHRGDIWSGFETVGGADTIDAGDVQGDINTLQFELTSDGRPCFLFSTGAALFSCWSGAAYQGLGTSARYNIFEASSFYGGAADGVLPVRAAGLKIAEGDLPLLMFLGDVAGSTGQLFVTGWNGSSFAALSGTGTFDKLTDSRQVALTNGSQLAMSRSNVPHVVWVTTSPTIVRHTHFKRVTAAQGTVVTVNLNSSGETVSDATIVGTYETPGDSTVTFELSNGSGFKPATPGSPVTLLAAGAGSGVGANAITEMKARITLKTSSDGISPVLDNYTVAWNTTGSTTAAGLNFTSVRYGDANRRKTAIVVNKTRFPTDGSAKAAMFCQDANPVDCESAASLASELDATLLLNPKTTLDSDVAAELDRSLGDRGEEVIVLGGTAAIADSVVAQLQSLGFTNVTRSAGATRIGTAAAITSRFRSETADHGKGVVKRMFIANLCTGPIDALVMGAVAAFDPGGPRGGMLGVCDTSTIPAETLTELANNPSLTNVEVFGGTARISDAQLALLQTAVPGAAVRRSAGADRFKTADAAARTFYSNPAKVGLAAGAAPNGGLSVDALVFAPLMASKGGPILLTPNTTFSTVTAAYFQSIAPYVIELNTVGGTVAVSDAVKAAAEQALGH